MTIEATIKDCITTGTYERRLACVTSDSEVQEAIKLMRERDIKSVLVKENDEYVGIVTETDLLFDVFISQNDPKTTKVSFIMTKPIITMDQDKSLKEAIELMRNKRIKHLVVTKNDKMIGMLSTRDLLTFTIRNR